jgi:hypothetical protein
MRIAVTSTNIGTTLNYNFLFYIFFFAFPETDQTRESPVGTFKPCWYKWMECVGVGMAEPQTGRVIAKSGAPTVVMQVRYGQTPDRQPFMTIQTWLIRKKITKSSEQNS